MAQVDPVLSKERRNANVLFLLNLSLNTLHKPHTETMNNVVTGKKTDPKMLYPQNPSLDTKEVNLIHLP